jgi:alpha-galactosidase
MPIHAHDHAWVLETTHTAYACGLNSVGLLTHRYWGPKLPYSEDYPPAPNPTHWSAFNNAAHLTPEEFPGYNDIKFIEPCLKVTFADQVRDVVLQFQGAQVDGETLTITLRDTVYPLLVRLIYRVWDNYDLIERSVQLENTGSDPITVERVFSAQWHLPLHTQPYRFTHLTGRWTDEFHIRQEALHHGVKVIESRRLQTSHHHVPWFALDRGAADEDQGEVWYGTLGWSGNWKLAAEVTDFASTRVSIGLNDWDFAYVLQPGESFTAPSAYAGYTAAGFGQASRTLHDLIREQILPHKSSRHQVLYNSWEATFFSVNVESQQRYAEIAAAMGVELFVMDDGWFHGRNHDAAGLGDWWPDAAKFPNGLKPLIEHVKALGMDFGLWIEPEMVNRDSDLYRAHPDWVLHFPTRQRTEGRNQLILNMARADVQAYLLEKLDTLLSENAIDFIKWDMNRSASEAGWPDYPGEAREIWVRYVEGVYKLWGTLRERHPHVVWQSCSGGGGRIDLGILAYADQVWPSDNTRPTARLAIQEGFSQAFPAQIMEAWVTDMEPHNPYDPREGSHLADFMPLSFRFHVSMCGALGIGANITHWTEAERTEAAHWISLYKDIRHLVQMGDQYRLRSAQAGQGFSAVQYMSKDQSEGVLFAFRTHIPEPSAPLLLRLRGLNPQARYTVEGFEGTVSGLGWMQRDLHFALPNFGSTVRRIQRL